MKKLVRRGVALVLAGAICALPFAGSEIGTIFADEKSEAESKKAALEAEQASLQAELNALDSLKSDTEAYIKEVDAKSTKVANKIYKLTQKIESTQAQIDQLNVQLTEAQASLEQQYSDMSLRIQYMYENGDTQYLNLLLSAENFSDFLNKAEYVNTITKYDNELFKKMEETANTIASTKTQLENENASLEESKAKQEKKQEELNTLLAKKQADLDALNTQTASTASEIAGVSAEISAEEANIAYIEELEKARAAKEAEAASKAAAEAAAAAAAASNAGSSSSSNTYNYDDTDSTTQVVGNGSYIWPLPGGYHTVSTEFGETDAFGSSGHCGVDYPAPSGTPIYAVAGGTIESAGYSSGMGNYVIIYHGNGLSSIYMHASALLCSTGDTVSQGQTIALVGTTGPSTGNHLHISFRLNGVYVNPHNYIGY